ncbi:hypothetical protein IKF92_02065 [Candidatus Saccharibacteria bacterium]|nr:hypothetical protein [Candidatus Saccharibacteria bacterium]
MEYKVLVKLFVPEIENAYEAYIPINKTVGQVSLLLNHMVSSLSGVYPAESNIILYNRRTNTPYDRGILVRDTDIRNGTELVMIS